MPRQDPPQNPQHPSTPPPAPARKQAPTARQAKTTTTKTTSKTPKPTPNRPPSHRRATLPAPEARTITLNGVAVPYTLRVSARARRIRFVIRPTTGLEVVTPRGISHARIEDGLRAKAQWILTTGARMAQQTQPALAPLANGHILPYLGRRLLLVVRTGASAGRFRATMTALAAQPPSATASATPVAPVLPPRPAKAPARRSAAAHGFTQGLLDLTPHAEPPTQPHAYGAQVVGGAADGEADGALTLTVATADEKTIRAALEAWYRRQAQAIVAERLALWNQHYGFTYHRVTIKEQKTRWGSCSRKGNLNFNWRLLLAPLDILDYVLIHELSHLKEQNHSPRFWAVVAQACPEYRERRRWLRLHGHELRF